MSTREEAVRLYRDGLDLAQVADRMALPFSRIQKWLKDEPKRSRKRIDPREVEAADMYRAGKSAREIAGCFWGTLYGWLKSFGVPKHGKAKARPVDPRPTRAVEMRRAGVSAPEIAETMSVTVQAVYRWLRDAGLGGRARVVVDRDAVVAAYAAGLSAEGVAKQLKTSPGTVNKYARRAGVYRPRRAGALHPLRVAEPERECMVCLTVKSTAEFELIEGKGKLGTRLNSVCVECSGNAEAWQWMRETARRCRKCGGVFTAANFYSAHSYTCKRCHLEQGKPKTAEQRKRRNAYSIQWQKDNPDKVKEREDRRRARKLGAPVVDFTLRQWRELLEEHEHCCAYCGVGGVRLERDHIVPLTRGGSHTKSNIAPACRTCNASKNSRTLAEWLAGENVSIAELIGPPQHIPIRPRTNAGEGNYGAKITDGDVRAIRELYASGCVTQKELSLKFGVHQSIVCEIISRKRWKHVA